MKIVLLMGCLCLAGCGGVNVQTYKDQTPALDLKTFFSGRVDAWGIFQKRSGEVAKRMHVVVDSHQQGDALILHEAFTYSDGTHQVREWTLRPDGPGRWRGTAGDVVGEATGEIAGNTLHWSYDLNLPVDGKTWQVHFDDWMYLLDDHTLANRSSMSKWGVELGQVSLFFRKP